MEHQKVPKEEATLETIRALEDQCRDCYLAVGQHERLEKRTQGNSGSWQKLAAAQGQLTRHTIPALQKECSHRGCGKTTDDGIRGWNRRQELHLGSNETFYEALWQTLELEVVKRAVGITRSEWLDIVEALACSKIKKTSKAEPLENKDDGDKPWPARTLSGNHLGWVALKREQWEKLGSNHCENQATGKEGKADHKRHKNSPQKRRNGTMPVRYLGWIVLSREHGM
jgi:hypothetical protein